MNQEFAYNERVITFSKENEQGILINASDVELHKQEVETAIYDNWNRLLSY